ncbi:hypothetical protein FACS1894166_03140 [Bacilli bacterium]|nr:hypothetical protein FACS1894166_03140 [Bacilli bacterium]
MYNNHMSSSQIVGTVFIAIAFVLIGYFLGSILFGAIVANRFKKDLRNIASGNVGATNVIRVVGKGVGIFVMFLDAIKGYVAIAICFLIYHFSIGK